MAIKHKKIVVSAKKPLFGRQSEMDKEIAKWTSKGWELTDTTASNVKDHFRLSFEYAADEKGTSGRGRGCLIAFGVIIAFALISNSQKSDTSSIIEPEKPTVVAQVATETQTVKSSQLANKNPEKQSLTSTAVKPDTLPTSTLIPTRKLPTATLVPTQIFATVKSGNINARECASIDCGIVRTVAIGDKISVSGLDGNWYLVTFDDGVKGYIRQDLLTVPDSAEVATMPTHVPTRTSIPTETPIRFSESEILISIKTVMFSQGYPIESIKMQSGNLVVDAAFSPNDSFDDADANVKYQFSLMGLLLGSTVTAFRSEYTTINPPNKINIGFTLSGIRIYHILINYSDGLAFIQNKITADQLQERFELITD